MIHEGEYGRDLYLILEGKLEMTATDGEGAELPVAILRRGEYAGEDGMLTGHPYKASARTQTPTLLLQVPEQVMQRLMELVPSVRNHFELFNNARSLKSILKRMALFQRQHQEITVIVYRANRHTGATHNAFMRKTCNMRLDLLGDRCTVEISNGDLR